MLSVPHLNHDHCERENVYFLAVPLPFQNLRGGPPKTETLLERDDRYGIQILSYISEAKTCDEDATIDLHKDIGLVRCQRGMKLGPKKLRTPLRLPCITPRE